MTDEARQLEGLRARADRLGAGRQAQFTRRGREETSEADERMCANAVARAKTGDREALRYLYVRYADHVYGYVRSIVRDDYEAEDVTQQVFAKLMTVLGRYEQRSVPFTRWMLRLAHNAAVDQLRARRAAPVEEIRGADEQGDDGMAERARSLRTALDALPEDQRTVVLLRHVAGLSPGEIAEALGRTRSSVHGLHHRGRGALCAELRDLDAAPAIRTAPIRTAQAA